jgi:hypothetical protein
MLLLQRKVQFNSVKFLVNPILTTSKHIISAVYCCITDKVGLAPCIHHFTNVLGPAACVYD